MLLHLMLHNLAVPVIRELLGAPNLETLAIQVIKEHLEILEHHPLHLE